MILNEVIREIMHIVVCYTIIMLHVMVLDELWWRCRSLPAFQQANHGKSNGKSNAKSFCTTYMFLIVFVRLVFALTLFRLDLAGTPVFSSAPLVSCWIVLMPHRTLKGRLSSSAGFFVALFWCPNSGGAQGHPHRIGWSSRKELQLLPPFPGHMLDPRCTEGVFTPTSFSPSCGNYCTDDVI